MNHSHSHAFDGLRALHHEGLVFRSRRNFLKASLAGLGSLSLPRLLAARADQNSPASPGKAVILLWMTGGPSHIDTWDPKPDRPLENRGPFGVIETRLPGVFICEHMPKMASMLDRFTLVRSLDAHHSNHEPNQVMQTGYLDAAPRVNPRGDKFPAIGSSIARFRGANQAGMPPYVAFQVSRSHIAHAGVHGAAFDPFPGHRAAALPIYTNVGVDTKQVSQPDALALPRGLDATRVRSRHGLLADLDHLRREVEGNSAIEALDRHSQQAIELLTGPRAHGAFDLAQEPEPVRERYGTHLWCQQALLARRLVEAGVAFVSIDLSYHPASGTWDTHGDNIPPYGGISKGLQPLLPLFDHLITTLVSDLEERGLLNDVLVLALGEFGRTPKMGTQGSSDGRDHWPVVGSMAMAGGGLRHGQVIGSTEPDGGYIASRPVTPGDLAATIYQHMGVPLDTTYQEEDGRLRFLVEKGVPISEFF